MKILGSKFYFVRHGQTARNQKKLCQGIHDIPLNDQGRKETFLLGRNSVGFPITHICSSPLLRAAETAQIIRQFHSDVPLTIIDELKERDWGELVGMSSNKMYEIEEQEQLDSNYSPGMGVEPLQICRDRIAKGLNKSFQCHPNPLIVSHGRAFLALCDMLNLSRIIQIPNLCLLEIQKVGNSWTSNIVALRN